MKTPHLKVVRLLYTTSYFFYKLIVVVPPFILIIVSAIMIQSLFKNFASFSVSPPERKKILTPTAIKIMAFSSPTPTPRSEYPSYGTHYPHSSPVPFNNSSNYRTPSYGDIVRNNNFSSHPHFHQYPMPVNNESYIASSSNVPMAPYQEIHSGQASHSYNRIHENTGMTYGYDQFPSQDPPAEMNSFYEQTYGSGYSMSTLPYNSDSLPQNTDPMTIFSPINQTTPPLLSPDGFNFYSPGSTGFLPGYGSGLSLLESGIALSPEFYGTTPFAPSIEEILTFPNVKSGRDNIQKIEFDTTELVKKVLAALFKAYLQPTGINFVEQQQETYQNLINNYFKYAIKRSRHPLEDRDLIKQIDERFAQLNYFHYYNKPDPSGFTEDNFNSTKGIYYS